MVGTQNLPLPIVFNISTHESDDLVRDTVHRKVPYLWRVINTTQCREYVRVMLYKNQRGN